MKMSKAGILILIGILLVGCNNMTDKGVADPKANSEITDNYLSVMNELNEENKESENETSELIDENKRNSKEDNKDDSKSSSDNTVDKNKTTSNNKKKSTENKEESKSDNTDDQSKAKAEDKKKKEEEKKEEIIEEKVLSSSLSQFAIGLINQIRSEAGLNQLSYSSYLGNIALERAKQIVDDFSHNRFYSDYQSKDYKLGECLAYGYGSAQNAVNGWMASSAHRNVLMDSENVSIGVAYCGEYWVAIVSY